jgi:hypothetical protein
MECIAGCSQMVKHCLYAYRPLGIVYGTLAAFTYFLEETLIFCTRFKNKWLILRLQKKKGEKIGKIYKFGTSDGRLYLMGKDF